MPLFSRREFGALAVALTASACSNLRQTVSDIAEPDIGAGIVVRQNGAMLYSAATGYAQGLSTHEGPRIAFTPDTAFRAASISKTVTLLTVQALVDAGRIGWDMDVQAVLGINPTIPDVPITLAHLISHTSTISDPDIYWVSAPGDIRDILTADVFNKNAGQQVGPFFEYANLNYGIAATMIETVTQDRFDHLARDFVLAPLGLNAGFNWSGVSPSKRRAGASLYRKTGDAWITQTDGPDVLRGTEPSILKAEGFDLADYKPGTNGTLFSPQGGLRASLNDLAILSQKIGQCTDSHAVTWVFDGMNGQDEEGHFFTFGRGLYIYPPDRSPIPGYTLIGHHGEAYGLYAGMWHCPELNADISYAVTGTPDGPAPMTGRTPNMTVIAQSFLDLAFQKLI